MQWRLCLKWRAVMINKRITYYNNWSEINPTSCIMPMVSLFLSYHASSPWPWPRFVSSWWALAYAVHTIEDDQSLSNHIKWSRADVSMKWVGCPIIIYSIIKVRHQVNLLLLQLFTMRPSIYQVWVALLWPLATVEGAEILYISMKKTCCECEAYEMLHNNE